MQIVSRLALLSGFAACAVAASVPSFEINTPANVAQCEATILTWQGGVAPYTLEIYTPGQGTVFTATNLAGTSFGWDASLPAGTSVAFDVTDSTGKKADSAFVSIVDSSDSTCF